MDSLTITRPDDWHIHLRDEDFLPLTVADVARTFARAIVMPNLKPPVVNSADAEAYRDRIVQQIPQGTSFQPLMTLYLTDNTTPAMIDEACASDFVYAVKYYPAGATTNSASGVTDIAKCYDTIARMEEKGLPLLLHGEVTDSEIDIFDREAVFIEEKLQPLLERFPKLRVVLEHITTKAAAEFVQTADAQIGATITAHHLLYNRNHMLVGGIRPHYYCLPILKRNTHQQALIEAATSGNKRFFLGTDSAPHPISAKETDCGCAGCYTALNAIELYAEVFDEAGALDKLEAFASHNGPDFYGLLRNTEQIRLVRNSWQVPEQVLAGATPIKPLRAGEALGWQIEP